MPDLLYLKQLCSDVAFDDLSKYTTWELEFVEGMQVLCEDGCKLTDKQVEKLVEIHEKTKNPTP